MSLNVCLGTLYLLDRWGYTFAIIFFSDFSVKHVLSQDCLSFTLNLVAYSEVKL